MTDDLKWVLPVALILLHSCKPVKKNYSCEAVPSIQIEGREMKTIPLDLTSVISAKGTLTVLSKVMLKLYAKTTTLEFSKDEYSTKQAELMEEISEWLGGKNNGAVGNLFDGLSFSDDFEKNDFKVLAKPIWGELLQRGISDNDGRNVYNSLLTYEVKVTNLENNETAIDTIQCPDLMIKTCVYYKY